MTLTGISIAAPAVIVGVMGGGRATPADEDLAYRLGALIARQGWVLLNGGRNAGIMAASARGAWEQGGLTVGILPDDHRGGCSPHVRIPIVTGMGHGRNAINVLSSDVVVACPGGAGTLSEIALALKAGRPLVLLGWPANPLEGTEAGRRLHRAATPEEAVARIRELLPAGA
jgi:uncharacterized protein (TIGR00725 family)